MARKKRGKSWSDRIAAVGGTEQSLPAGFEVYAVLSKEPEEAEAGSGAPEGRGAVYDNSVARSSAFVAALKGRLEAKGLGQEWRLIKAGALPVITLACTAAVAAEIKTMPEVDTVIKDFGADVDRSNGR